MTTKNVCGENKYHSCYNQCGTCKHGKPVPNKSCYACFKLDKYVSELIDTSDCKDFEKREDGK